MWIPAIPENFDTPQAIQNLMLVGEMSSPIALVFSPPWHSLIQPQIEPATPP
jgi:hypothetical protein